MERTPSLQRHGSPLSLRLSACACHCACCAHLCWARPDHNSPAACASIVPLSCAHWLARAKALPPLPCYSLSELPYLPSVVISSFLRKPISGGSTNAGRLTAASTCCSCVSPAAVARSSADLRWVLGE